MCSMSEVPQKGERALGILLLFPLWGTSDMEHIPIAPGTVGHFACILDIYLLVLNTDIGKLINPINDFFILSDINTVFFLGKSAIIIQYISIYIYITYIYI